MQLPWQLSMRSSLGLLQCRIQLDGHEWDLSVGQHPITVTGTLLDEPGVEHTLIIELHSKTRQHVRQGDPLLGLEKFSIDQIDFTAMLLARSCYSHDFNGSGPAVREPFYGNMGCNGCVTFEFTSPVYPALLDFIQG